jgi:nucleotide-binding universal stress UspA family protein
MTDNKAPVVVATDLGPRSDVVMQAAVGLAKTYSAPLVPIHVLTPASLDDYRESMPPEGAYVDVLLERLTSDVTTQARKAGAGDALADPIVLTGQAASSIIDATRDQKAAFLVIGIRNRSRVGKLLMGSDAQEIILGSPCPIVGVPV